MEKLNGVSDPETKRKTIGEEFIRAFERESKKLGTVDFLAQGTIYPDVIESGSGDAAVIKSHHNVGGLPDYVDFKEIIEPLRLLFKDEVRQLGIELGLPENLVWRQPFRVRVWRSASSARSQTKSCPFSRMPTGSSGKRSQRLVWIGASTSISPC